MVRGTRVFFSVALLPLGLGMAVFGTPASDVVVSPAAVAGPVSYANQIAPLFEESCTSCHGEEEQEAGLRLDTYAAAMTGSEYGTVIEAGNPGESLLVDMIAAGEMPQEADAWDAEEVDLVRSWIAEGANDN